MRTTFPPIAIVGIGCRFPGGANSPEEFWQLLCDGTDAITEIPRERFDIEKFYHPDPARPGKLYIRRAGFADFAAQFDAAFFGISPREALQMDPQQRMLLEVAWEALEDGGLVAERLAGSRSGVFVGISTHDYADLIAGPTNRNSIEAHTATGTATSIAANRISYVFDFRGPSIAVDTACSSSLTAIHLACHALARDECELALAGGVNLFLSPDSAMGLAKASMLSPDGRCRAFDALANGFVRGEGVGLIVVKRLDAALRDGDRIYASISASAINQDGRTVGIMVPSGEAQEVMFREALSIARVEPSDIQYMEAHGTGTAVGDPIEATAIGRVFSVGRLDTAPLRIGSVKTNIGHLEAAAGVAGVIKTALMLTHRQIPPHLNFTQPNPAISFDQLRLTVPLTLQPWPASGDRARAGVNSFGVGGANAHVLMEEAPSRRGDAACAADDAWPRVLTLSARSPEALRERAFRMTPLLAEGGPSLDDICLTAAAHRSHLEHRLAVVGVTRAEMLAGLASFAQGHPNPSVLVGRAPGTPPKVGLVYTGMGVDMAGRSFELLRQEVSAREVFERCDDVLGPLGHWSLLTELADGSASRTVGEVAVVQVKNYVIQAAITALLRAWGVVPHAVTGHSVGEVAAAQAAGVLTLEDGLRVVFHRGRLAQRVNGKGRMLAAAISEQDALSAIDAYGDRVAVAAVNSAGSVTLSGEGTALEEIAARLEARGCFCRFIAVTVPYHSGAIDAIGDEFQASISDLTAHPAVVKLASSTLGEWIGDAALDASHWWRNLRQPVRFDAAVRLLAREGCELFLEVGPHPILRTYLAECLDAEGGRAAVLATLRQGEDDRLAMLRAVATLHTRGCRIDWRAVHAGRGTRIALPSYPWQRQYFGTGREIADRNAARLGGTDSGHPLLGLHLPTPRPSWQAELADGRLDYLEDHRVRGTPVVPAAAYIEMAMAAAERITPDAPTAIGRMRFERMLVLPERRDCRIQIACDAQRRFEIHSTASDGAPWTLHAQGDLCAVSSEWAEQVDVAAVQQRCPRRREIDDMYDLLERRGLGYRAAFRRVEAAWEGNGEAIGRIRLAEAGGADDDPYCIHPAILDCALQLLTVALGSSEESEASATYLPASLERVDWIATPATPLWVHAQVGARTSASVTGNVRLFDDLGRVLLSITGIEAVRVGREHTPSSVPFALYALEWVPRRRAEPDDTAPSALPSPHELVQAVTELAAGLNGDFRSCVYTQSIEQGLNTLAVTFIRRALRSLGADVHILLDSDSASVARRLGVASRHQRLLARLLHIAARAVEEYGDGDPALLARQLETNHPEWADALSLILRCGNALGAILRGELEAAEVLFTPDVLPILENVYTSAPCLAWYNRALAEVASRAVRASGPGTKLRVLEIGAGTGGLTAGVLSRLPAGAVDYCFTDVSPFFLRRAQERFAGRPDLRFSLLDIEHLPTDGSLLFDRFDVVIAANVVHGTADLHTTLGNVRQLLAPDGVFVMLELVVAEAWADLIFGLFDGWWRFSDVGVRPTHAVLDRDRWLSVLRRAGFTEALSIPDLEFDPHPLHTVIVASSGGPDATATLTRRGGRWLIVRDRGTVATRLAGAMEARGCICTIVDMVEAAGQMDTRWDGIVHLAALDLPALGTASSTELLSHEVRTLSGISDLLRAAQAGEHRPRRLWLVTAGAQPLDEDGAPLSVLQAPVWAAGRVAMYEFPNLACRLADLSGVVRPEEIDALAAEICANGEEEEVALRGNERFVARLRRVAQTDESRGIGRRVSVHREQVRLEISEPGTLDALSLCEVRPVAPGPDEVLVRVHAAGLNFKDVMHALGLLPFDLGDPRSDTRQAFGFECSGVVVAVGERCERLRPGDEVCGIGTGTFGTHVRVPEQFAFRVPASLSLLDAAGVLLPFITAHFSLNHLARLGAGERILIHSASGGVGLAAIQVSRQIGAEIFATAGTPEKRAWLEEMGIAHVMDSRSLDFAERISEVTRGEGVDVVLNSLAGAAIEKGLVALRPFGRFVELGKRDFLQNSAVGLAPFERHLSFFAVDVDRVRKERPDLCASLATEVLAQFGAGTLHPLPRTDFRLSDAPSAFRHMAQGKHIGKIVLTAGEEEYVARPSRAQHLFASDATYLITGGLGGFGLATAQWMVEQGARHIVLTGRNAEPLPTNRAAFDRLLASAASITVLPADVTSEDQTERLLAEIRNALPPLRGVFHEAMVLDDRKLVDLTPDGWERVMAPKIAGAWNLHRLTGELDYFVLFSSSTVVLGNVGQANYAAGNAFLDALAMHRRKLGLPGLSVAWGLLGGVGLVVDRTDLQQYFSRIGFEPITVGEAFTTLEQLLRDGAGYAMPFRMDWHRLASISVSARTRIAEMLPSVDNATTAADSGPTQAPINWLAGDDGPASLEAYLRGRLGFVLGTSAAAIDGDVALTNLGLDSLMAVELESVIKRDLGMQVAAVRLLQGASLHQLMASLLAHQDTAPAPAFRRPLMEADARLPLAPSQRRLWFLQQLDPASVAYNMPMSLRLEGKLDVPALEAALNDVWRRQDALRATILVENGEPLQTIAPYTPLALPITDLSGDPTPHATVHRLEESESRRVFDLAVGPLFRCRLIRMSEETHVLLAIAHHLVVDAWSPGIISRQAAECYAARCSGREPLASPPSPTYSEFVDAQVAHVAARETAQLAYWTTHLQGIPALTLRGDRRRPRHTFMPSARRSFDLPHELRTSLDALSKREGVTLYMTLLAAFDVLLAHRSGQAEFCVGSPVATRAGEGAASLVGCFVNTVAMRASVPGSLTFRQLLAQTKKTVLAAFANQDVPWERVVETLHPTREGSALPVFQTLLVVHNMPRTSTHMPGLRMTSQLLGTGSSPFDLMMLVDSMEGRCTLEYSAAMFDAATADSMIDEFLRIVSSVVEDADRPIGALQQLDEAERHQLLIDWNNAAAPRAVEEGVHRLFELQAVRTPDATAIVADDATLTYADLDRAAEKLAATLRREGVGPEILVGVALERSARAVVAMLGILKAGGAFVPLDIASPAARLLVMVKDAKPRVVVTESRFARTFDGLVPLVLLDSEQSGGPEGDGSRDETVRVAPESLAYVMFTSGSTGRPKGVMVEHRSVLNQIAWRQAAYPLTSDDVVLQSTSLGFDPAIWEILGPLSCGASLVVAPGGHHDVATLRRAIQQRGVTTMQVVPSVLRVLLEQRAFDGCRSLRRIFVGGEPLDETLHARLRDALPAELIVLYGCTETTIDATHYLCPTQVLERAAPIGRPIANARVYILNDALQPVPIGVPGQLCVAGSGVARGYLNDAQLRSERFIDDPFAEAPGERAYLTGDLARWSREGVVEFLGRTDRQLKVRGFRIEPSEIELALRRHPSIRETVVGTQRDPAGNALLVAWIVADGDAPSDTGALKAHLAESLPEHMVPSLFVQLDALPLTPSGKIDPTRLPAATGSTGPHIAPRSELERQLASVWQELLGVESVGTTDGFFDLGGHSLLAVQLAFRIGPLLGGEVSCQEIFANPTIAALVAARARSASDASRLAEP